MEDSRRRACKGAKTEIIGGQAWGVFITGLTLEFTSLAGAIDACVVYRALLSVIAGLSLEARIETPHNGVTLVFRTWVVVIAGNQFARVANSVFAEVTHRTNISIIALSRSSTVSAAR